MTKRDEQLAEGLEGLDDRELRIFMSLALSKIERSTRSISTVVMMFAVLWLVGVVLALIGVAATGLS